MKIYSLREDLFVALCNYIGNSTSPFCVKETMRLTQELMNIKPTEEESAPEVLSAGIAPSEPLSQEKE